MAKVQELKLFNFQGQGMADTERDLADGNFRYLENVTFGDSARELKQVATLTKSDSTRQIIATLNVNGTIYGLGSYGGKTAIWVTADSGTTWNHYVCASNSENAVTTQVNPFFCYFNGYIYFQSGAVGIATLKVSDNTISDGHWCLPDGGNPTYGGVAWQGNMYGWLGNTIFKLTTGGTASDMLTIPADQQVVELISYSNLMAVICKSTVGESKMYLWDGVTTTTFYDIVSEGTGIVAGGVLVDGTIRIVIGGNNNKDFRIRDYSGGVFNTVFYYSGRKNQTGVANATLISRVKVSRGFIYFMVEGTKPSSTATNNISLFRFGNKVSGQTNSLCAYSDFAFVPGVTGSLLNDFTILDGQSTTSDYFSIFAVAYDVASPFATKEFVSLTGFSVAPGAIETGIYTLGDSATTKHFKVLALHHAPLTTGQSVSIYYRKDSETSWTELGASSEVGTVHYHINNIEISGSPAPDFNEIAFRIEMIGNPVLTGFRFKAEELEDIYG